MVSNPGKQGTVSIQYKLVCMNQLVDFGISSKLIADYLWWSLAWWARGVWMISCSTWDKGRMKAEIVDVLIWTIWNHSTHDCSPNMISTGIPPGWDTNSWLQLMFRSESEKQMSTLLPFPIQQRFTARWPSCLPPKRIWSSVHHIMGFEFDGLWLGWLPKHLTIRQSGLDLLSNLAHRCVTRSAVTRV